MPRVPLRRSRSTALIGARAARVAAIALLAAAPPACGESSTSGGGTGGVSAGAAGFAGSGGAPTSGGSPGAVGGLSLGGASAGGASNGGACHQNGERCSDARDCCATATCNNTAQAAALNGCHPVCSKNADCATGCCVLFQGAMTGICAEAMWCGCGMSGAACGGQLPACCGDQICLANDATRSAYACQKVCMTNADCPSKCCVAIPGIGKSACLDPMYCPAM